MSDPQQPAEPVASPLHPNWPCDKAVQLAAPIVEHVSMAKDTRRLRVFCPPIACSISPGQFVMIRLAGYNDPLLGRALALYDTAHGANGQPETLDVVYLVKGKFTSRLANFLPGQQVEIWGPLGNGFTMPDCDELILVAGGIGQTPFVAVAKEFLGLASYGKSGAIARKPNRRVTLCYGARSADYLAGIGDIEQLGVEVRLATDDGTRGLHGFVTDVLRAKLAEPGNRSRKILCCGPEPMMQRVAQIAAETNTPCDVSLEAPMACGIGVCFTCVAKVRDANGNWDYKRTCVEGPVFDASKIEWE